MSGVTSQLLYFCDHFLPLRAGLFRVDDEPVKFQVCNISSFSIFFHLWDKLFPPLAYLLREVLVDIDVASFQVFSSLDDGISVFVS